MSIDESLEHIFGQRRHTEGDSKRFDELCRSFIGAVEQELPGVIGGPLAKDAAESLVELAEQLLRSTAESEPDIVLPANLPTDEIIAELRKALEDAAADTDGADAELVRELARDIGPQLASGWLSVLDSELGARSVANLSADLLPVVRRGEDRPWLDLWNGMLEQHGLYEAWPRVAATLREALAAGGATSLPLNLFFSVVDTANTGRMLLASRDRPIASVLFEKAKAAAPYRTVGRMKRDRARVRSSRVRVGSMPVHIVRKKREKATDPEISELVFELGFTTGVTGTGMGLVQAAKAARSATRDEFIAATEEEEMAILGELEADS